ncbi:PRC-barrel domain-containing protein [Streptomyces sp. BA2]|uniref:PRC-barrel domain-containing protein n=1 Tax=Streptomyces sp. BA2 TaxID=436595 RepID=UPI00132C18CD|nr:PRC-barrel domain-containing protein [Streptomyces sp. BA2]MWA09534.1 PRC-barrel domain containing protein [Streptomyces sp. BA2]
MITLMLAAELTKRPVVTLGGEVVAQVKDTVFDASGGQITGFTLAGRGLLSGPLKQSLPWSGVHALGPDAVMIPSAEVLQAREVVVDKGEAGTGQVRGARVLSDAGLELGTVLDAVVEGGTSGRVAGFEVATTEAMGRHERRAFLPAHGQLAMTGDTLVIPAQVAGQAVDDLDALAAAWDRTRTAGETGFWKGDDR